MLKKVLAIILVISILVISLFSTSAISAFDDGDKPVGSSTSWPDIVYEHTQNIFKETNIVFVDIIYDTETPTDTIPYFDICFKYDKKQLEIQKSNILDLGENTHYYQYKVEKEYSDGTNTQYQHVRVKQEGAYCYCSSFRHLRTRGETDLFKPENGNDLYTDHYKTVVASFKFKARNGFEAIEANIDSENPPITFTYFESGNKKFKYQIRKGTLLGDANQDCKLNIADVSIIQDALAEFMIDRKIPTNKKTFDFNLDGTLSIKDATEFQRFLAEFDVDKSSAYGKYLNANMDDINEKLKLIY